jgi:hypothetical protein
MNDQGKSIPLNEASFGQVGSHKYPSRKRRRIIHLPSLLVIRLRGKGGKTKKNSPVFLGWCGLLLEHDAAEPREDKEVAAKMEDPR